MEALNSSVSSQRFTLREAATRHGLNEWTLRRAIRRKLVEFYTIGNRYELTDEAVIRFLDRSRQPVAA